MLIVPGYGKEYIMEYEDKTRTELIDEIRRLTARLVALEGAPEPTSPGQESGTATDMPSVNAAACSSSTFPKTERTRLEQELGDIRKRYRLILDAVPANISYVDTDLRLRFINKWHEKWFGKHPKEIVGRDIRGLFGQEFYPRVETYITAALQGNEVTFETIVSIDRVDRSLAVTLVPNKDNGGPVLGFYILAYDVTDRIQAEEALRRSEREKDLILDSVTELVVYRDLEFKIIWTNRAMEDLFGLPQESLIGLQCYKNLRKRSEPCVGCPVLLALQSGEPREAEITHSDGRTWYIKGFPTRDHEGQISGVVEFAQEITVRKQTEERLRKNEMQLAEAQQIAHLGSWEYDLLNNNFLWSDELYRICDLDKGNFRLTFKEILRIIHPEDLELFKLAIETAYRSRHPFSLYHRIVRPNGTVRILHSQGKVDTNGTGVPTRIIGTAVDVTARKKAEEILKQKHLQLKQFTRVLEERVEEEVAKNRQKDYMLIQQARQAAMGEMIGNIAHQWRQPLTTVSLLIQNLTESYVYGGFSREFMEETIESSMQVIQYMSQTIDDFRNFFKPDKDKSAFQVGDVIKKTISFVEASMKYHNIRISVEEDGELLVTGYPNEYAQVLLNIISNARDALLEGNVGNPEIRIKARREKKKSVVTVVDNAGGIPENVMDKIYEPYFTTKELGKGTGVGLYMSKTIIEKHMNGRLSAKNTHDGVEFRIEV